MDSNEIKHGVNSLFLASHLSALRLIKYEFVDDKSNRKKLSEERYALLIGQPFPFTNLSLKLKELFIYVGNNEIYTSTNLPNWLRIGQYIPPLDNLPTFEMHYRGETPAFIGLEFTWKFIDLGSSEELSHFYNHKINYKFNISTTGLSSQIGLEASNIDVSFTHNNSLDCVELSKGELIQINEFFELPVSRCLTYFQSNTGGNAIKLKKGWRQRFSDYIEKRRWKKISGILEKANNKKK
ncbi:hypothetical protein ASG65_01555 [Bacillus sp. Leaf13]|nr:hypothetical protein ASG65_01555 [Bacillus sp. Leaf13]